MKLAQSVSEILSEHVTLEVESIDRMYLNAIVPLLQSGGGIAWFFREHRGHSFASSALMAPMSRAFVSAIEGFADREEIELVIFEKGQRKEELAAEYRSRFRGEEGLLFIGRHKRSRRFSGPSGAGIRQPVRRTAGFTERRRW